MKVCVHPPDEKLFFQIFVSIAKQLSLPFEKDSFIYLLQRWYRESGRKLQAVHPRDLLRIVVTLCEYENSPLRLTPDLLDEACRSYFVD